MGDEAGHTSPMISAKGSSLGCCIQCTNYHTNIYVRTKSVALLYFTDDPETHQCFVLLRFSLIIFFHFSPHFVSFLFPPCIPPFSPIASHFSYLFHSCCVFLLLLTFCLLFPVYLFIYLFSKYIF